MCKPFVVVAALISALFFGACAGTSYGVTTDGTFPPKPAGATYPSWEHICVVFDSSNATETLNNSGGEGWELVGMGIQGADSLMCFKRPKQ